MIIYYILAYYFINLSVINIKIFQLSIKDLINIYFNIKLILLLYNYYKLYENIS
jgi:hypothetical protein